VNAPEHDTWGTVSGDVCGAEFFVGPLRIYGFRGQKEDFFRQLEHIKDYLTEHHPYLARSTVLELYEAIRSLKIFPQRGAGKAVAVGNNFAVDRNVTALQNYRRCSAHLDVRAILNIDQREGESELPRRDLPANRNSRARQLARGCIYFVIAGARIRFCGIVLRLFFCEGDHPVCAAIRGESFGSKECGDCCQAELYFRSCSHCK